jgi:hypothetical protein
MAYNMIKGDVLGSVDQHADQEIDGVKVFKNTVSASIFYDTDAGEPCITIKDVPIRELHGSANKSIITYEADGVARANHNLTFDGQVFSAPRVKAEIIIGNASGVTRLPSNQFVGKIGSEFIKFGSGLKDVRGSLQVLVHEGIKCDEEGVALNFSSNSGLSIKDEKVYVDPTKTEQIDLGGQNIADSDLLLVADVSSGTTKHTTLKNLYDNYIDNKVLHPAGQKGYVQFSDGKDLGADSALSFNPKTKKLNVEGKIDANTVIADNKLVSCGSVFMNIRKVSDNSYKVQKDDYTILCQSDKGRMTVTLPPACDNSGRVLIIKKANLNKYKINSQPIIIKSVEGTIDINEEMAIKMNYSSRTLQSDGENWWIIGSKGS